MEDTSGSRKTKPIYGMGRRDFLWRSVGASLGLITAVSYTKEKAEEIERIDLFPVLYPTKGYFKFFLGPRGAYGRGAVIVKIIADSGSNGKMKNRTISGTRAANFRLWRGCSTRLAGGTTMPGLNGRARPTSPARGRETNAGAASLNTTRLGYEPNR